VFRFHALVVFDLDGTLLRGRTVCEVLAEPLGRLQRMREIERITSHRDALRAAREEMAAWYRPVGLERLRGALDTACFAPGVADGLALLRASPSESRRSPGASPSSTSPGA
jgi:phosphoserine phosphatase